MEKNTTNRYCYASMSILLCLLQLISCNSFEKKSLATASDNCVLLVDSISNSYKIKEIGNVQNLEILNGLKGFQFGMNSKLLHECITLERIDNQFSVGFYQNSFSFQDISWHTVLLAFEYDKLIGVVINGKVGIKTCEFLSTANEGSPYVLQRNFIKLLGLPNYKPLTIVDKKLSNTSLFMTYNFKDKKPTRESLSSLLSDLSHTQQESSINPIQVYISDLTRDFTNREKPQACKLQLEYYETLKMTSSWESSIFLKIDYARNRMIETSVAEMRKYNGETVVAFSDYNFNDTWDINISMFANRGSFNSFNRVNEQNILKKAVEKAKNENFANTKKLIDGF
ncbi:hypothetical protein [Breznakibacter xylanolyticus]|nr:hypothetical protein [Breznakibacter xylanolyticus]